MSGLSNDSFFLEPVEDRPPAEFFELQPFLRSAMLGALIPATAIASGHVLVVQAEVLGKFFLRGGKEKVEVFEDSKYIKKKKLKSVSFKNYSDVTMDFTSYCSVV